VKTCSISWPKVYSSRVRTRRSAIAGLLVFALTIPLNEKLHAWEIIPGEDGFGTKRVLAITYFDQDTNVQSPDGEPDSENFAALGLRCMESKVEVLFAAYTSDKPLKWIKQSTVDVKFNNGKVEKWRVTFVPDKSGLFITDNKKFLQRLIKSNQIAIRGNGYSKRISANFDVTNIDEVRTAFKTIACKI
jgi:hypothetical protein